ncbi:MAG: sugar ABC transporter ATP-binding protein [Anaerolineaceae bacterium]
MEYILRMKGITKKFPGVVALDHVDLDLLKGEVLALVGENGAGKSTLIKIISGVYQSDEGTLNIDGKSVEQLTPLSAIDLGIAVIYQELNFLDELSIAENIFIGNLPKKSKNGLIDYDELKENSWKIQQIVGLGHVDPFTLVKELSISEKQLVEIARAYSKDFKILILDEPTSALNENETQQLFKIIRDLKKQGKSIIYISHKLDEVFEVADRIQVLRDGTCVRVDKAGSMTKGEIVRHIAGREIKDFYPIGKRDYGETTLEVKNLSTVNLLKNISFSVKRGEIVGIYGLMGAGCTDIVECLFGLRKHTAGEILINGKVVNIKNPRCAIQNGIAYLPSDRRSQGIVPIHDVKTNISIIALEQFKKFNFLNLKKEREFAEEWITRLNIKTPSVYTLTESLSGGNQQKVIVAKWMAKTPGIFIFNEPTRGIDVNAKTEIYKQIDTLCKGGCAVVVVSSELQEIMGVSDRIIIVYMGRVVGELTRAEATQEKIVSYAIGQ